MSWHVTMFGSLKLPERNVEEWLTTPFTTDEFPWLDELGGNETFLLTPEAVLSHISELQIAPHEIFDVRLDEAELKVSCFVSEDPYRDTCEPLALLFGSASAFGGNGALTFFGYQGIRFGERITVTSVSATHAQLTQLELPAVENDPAYKRLDARIHERFDSLVGRTPVRDARGAVWAIHPFTGRRFRVVAETKA